MVRRTEEAEARVYEAADDTTAETEDDALHEQAAEGVSDAVTKDPQQAILVVEDNPSLLEVLGMLLDFEQYRFALVADGQEALDWLARRRPALVILDWVLPKAGGYLVLAATRARYGPQVPVLVLSAVADAEEAHKAGADAYLRKPYAVEQLVGMIHKLLAT